MHDLNDLMIFARIVEHGGVAAAARAMGLPKSTVSRRLSALEDRLGVRLIQRTSRASMVTDVGRAYHRHCQAMIAAADAAQEVIAHNQAEPRGLIRMSCPLPLLSTAIAPILARFMIDFPEVRIEVDATQRRVDVVEEGFDLALRVRPLPLEDSDLVVRILGHSTVAIVAAPTLLDRHAPVRHPDDLARLPTVAQMPAGGRGSIEAVAPAIRHWTLTGPGGETVRIPHEPRFAADDLPTLHHMVRAGLGITILPHYLVQHDLNARRLVTLLPDWRPPSGAVHAAFPSRRGLVPAVRHLIDRLADEFNGESGLSETAAE
ncbi:LysR substrate-binding domain-containing protein [Tistrella bauzanensis]|uniref:LysR substrate-binding domain-containing protein n=1 Tax=Tistrella arctica TaxID=3133430 RepID=A0ABU9YEM5_9PROT